VKRGNDDLTQQYRRLAALALAAISAWPAIAVAAAPKPLAVATDSALFLEQRAPDNVRKLTPAHNLRRGDRVVTVLSWQLRHGQGGFVITNPLPPLIAYQASAREDEEISVDGGRSWGQLGTLRLGTRMATPEDVTHVRWRITPILASRGRGQIAYSGIVR
jgi:hypothetical protein